MRLGCEFAGELQGLVRKVQPLVFLAHAQDATAGVEADLAVRAAGGKIQLHVGVESALPGKVFGQPLREAFDGELLEVIAQFRIRHQALIFTAQTGRAGLPAMGAEVDLAVRQPLQFCRALQPPVLATGLDIAAGQASAPVAVVQAAVETQGQLQLRPLQVEGQFLAFDIALPTGGQGAERGVAGLDPAALEVDFRPLRAVEGGVQVQALQPIVGERQLVALQT